MVTLHRRLMPVAMVIAAFVVISGLAVVTGARGTSAHGDDPSHPAHIHSGTCAELGDVVFPLKDVGAATMDDNGTPMTGTTMGPESAIPVDVSMTTVQADLNTIISGGHAINVHESAENIGNYIACGDIGGTMMGSDLAIGLGELNGSGYSGVAWLHDNGDGSTDVSVFLTESEGEGVEAEGTAEAEASTGSSAMSVEIKDYSFQPAELDVAVGTTVTWTNDDSAPHTATQNGGGFQSDKIGESGGTYSYTFDTPGTYEYHCEYHPNMHGTVVVK